MKCNQCNLYKTFDDKCGEGSIQRYECGMMDACGKFDLHITDFEESALAMERAEKIQVFRKRLLEKLEGDGYDMSAEIAKLDEKLPDLSEYESDPSEVSLYHGKVLQPNHESALAMERALYGTPAEVKAEILWSAKLYDEAVLAMERDAVLENNYPPEPLRANIISEIEKANESEYPGETKGDREQRIEQEDMEDVIVGYLVDLCNSFRCKIEFDDETKELARKKRWDNEDNEGFAQRVATTHFVKNYDKW